MFVNFPRWGDPVQFTVAEIKNGKAEPFPNLTVNKLQLDDQANTLVSVQSVVIDPKDRLWIVDTGSINFQPNKPGGPKLWCIDLNTNEIIQRVDFSRDVVLPTTYLNDIRFDMSRGQEGYAFISDSSDSGPNAIIVIDLKDGTSWRKLNGHPSVTAEEKFVPVVEGEPLMARPPGDQPEAFMKIGVDGIAVVKDRVFYCPLAGRKLYSVPIDVLIDRNSSDEQAAAAIEDHGDRGFASDGLAADGAGNLYLTDYEHNAIHRRTPDGKYQTIARDPRMIWPDSMAISRDNQLYFTANQLNRQKQYHRGTDQRQRPFVLFRMPLDARPLTALTWD